MKTTIPGLFRACHSALNGLGLSRATVQWALTAGAIALALLGPQSVNAQERWPSKPLRFMIGFGPGGGTDMVSRLLAQKLSERIGQPVVPELKTGATGTIAADAVAKAAPDGHVLILLTGAYPVTGAMMRRLPFDPLRDFEMVSTIVTYPIVLVVRSDSPYRTIDQLIAAARSERHKVSFSTVGVGSGQHLIGEWIGAAAGLEFLHVPFRGQPAAMVEMISGRVDMMVDTLTSAYPHVRSGKTRALAVTTRSRSSFLPDVPTLSSIVPGVDFASWAGVATTGGTPVAVVNRLNAELRSILDLPEVRSQLANLAGTPSPSSPAAMRDLITGEIQRWNRVVDERRLERQ